MRQKETAYGTLKYRIPNIPEAMELLGDMGLNSRSLQNTDEFIENDLKYMARMIKSIGPFVDVTGLKIDEEEVTSFEDALNRFEFIQVFSEVAQELFESLNVGSKKKS